MTVDSAQRWVFRTVKALAIGWVALLLVVFVWRAGFPLELEWMEGGMLHQAHRIAHGQSPYPPPSADYVPFLYTPLYSVVLAALGSLFGIGLTLGRVISILAWAATLAAIFRAVRQEGGPSAHAWAAVGLACAGYVFCFRWLDLARPDTLFIALVTWGLVLLRGCAESWRRAVWAGVLVALAFWTKQTAASFVIASGLGALLIAPRRLFLYATTIAVIDGGGVLLGNALTDGRLWHYIYELHQSHAFNEERFTQKTWGMFAHGWPLVMLVVFGLVSRGLGRLPKALRGGALGRGAWRGPAYWVLMAAAGLLVSALGYSTQWAEPNAFIPGVVLGAIAVAVCLPRDGVAQLAALSLLGVQMVLCLVAEPHYHPVQKRGFAGLRESYGWQQPWRTLPTGEQWEQASQLRARIEAAPGPVLAIHRPWWSVLAGGSGHVGSMGITDVLEDDRRAITRQLVASVTAGEYAEVWIEGEPPRWLDRALRRQYRVDDRRHGARRVRPLSGYMSVAGMVTPYRRDQVGWVPKGPRPQPEGTTVIASFEGGALDGFEADGAAFRRPVRGPSSRRPAAGPYGGQWLLSSGGRGGRLPLRGSADSAAITLPAAGELQMLVGYTGRRPRGLSVQIVEDGDTRAVALPIPRTPDALALVQWTIEPDWAGAQIRVRLGDESPEASLYFDDLWLVP